jgi:hypothetical protein
MLEMLVIKTFKMHKYNSNYHFFKEGCIFLDEINKKDSKLAYAWSGEELD